MSGHSKWANIKHKKALVDAKRGKVFSVIVKKIASAARRGGGDLEMNPELRLYVQKARAANMPANNIERAILKATGQLEGVEFRDFTYEGYGAGGVAVFLEGATDNKNRTVSNVRYAFSKNGGTLGNDGCVAWMFHTKGVLAIEEELVEDVDELMEVALESGAEDLEVEDGVVTVTTSFEHFMAVRTALVEAGYTTFLQDEVTKVAENAIAPELKQVKQIMRMIEALEEDEDVENVYTNLELSDEVAAQI